MLLYHACFFFFFFSFFLIFGFCVELPLPIRVGRKSQNRVYFLIFGSQSASDQFLAASQPSLDVSLTAH